MNVAYGESFRLLHRVEMVKYLDPKEGVEISDKAR
jgi:hypothetical protein